MVQRNDQVVIDHRFRGPERSGNGGYVCGVIAEWIDGPAAIRLLAPIPLDVPLRRELDGETVRLRDDAQIYGEGRPVDEPLLLDIPIPPSLDDVARAAPHFPSAEEHILPECFVCGPKRDRPDGLCIYSGNHPDRPIAAALWTPDAALAGERGLVDPRFFWAALDCPSYFALGEPRPMALLAQLEGQLLRPVCPGEPLKVMGWPLGSEGRKHRSACALLDAKDEPVAMSRALWISFKSA
ncbi:hypothetical protein [Sphingomicrobium lutaoense]|uniref:Uncharacterized protein n=1 Tax=Sphingomicrobium lutaoense TaxID=515949 RepID=A0A839Z3B2_9SPHN|nr:hypothetical protein [Sphingomicrobium lutaoense]MBB3764567.1 hypothetical protein [Sphingomicrobium lutaoense]